MKILSKKQVYEYLENSKDDKFCIKPINSRTNNQNSYLWYMHKKASEVSGYTDDEMHDITSAMFIAESEVNFLGTDLTIKKSSSKLNKQDFSNFLIKVREFYENTFDLYLPDYNEFSLMEGKHL